MLPGLLRHLRLEAPQVSLVIRRSDHSMISNQLATGEVSLSICQSRDLPANAKRKFLQTIVPTVLSARSIVGSLDLDEYCKRPHVSVSLSGEMTDYIDEALSSQGRQRQVVLAVPQYSALKTLLEDSDLLAVVPEYVAKAMVGQGEFRMDPVPISLPSLDLSLSWSSTLDTDPCERWLRSSISHYLSGTGLPVSQMTFNKDAA
ncbi:LysR family transcriptional regulator, mexEF-oprN operon transcriptional activator [Pseudomonas abietaniphila]|uniref:LysR family transcriptional regulator, mexEF-oprN operon transcriptional activator n=2 Tax=Pseudomonas abietaniphila TaxID=89065 RepID=A0A1G8PSN0_9PSED|nr:LysR family transcriptional regulator, mexEF-oprN operon transcriptional activator [Pseudomonas abietaniphila]